MDKLILERFWEDYDFYELKVTASSNVISATTTLYIDEKDINKLSKELEEFIFNNENNYLWGMGKKGCKPYLSLNFIKKDTLGHFYVEIFMELNDGTGVEQHNCCFYIETELGLLLQFAKKVKNLNDYSQEVRVSLNNN